MTSLDIDSFQVGDWLVEPNLNQISRDDGNTNLPPRVMELLVYMKSQAGEVVSLDGIIENVWDGALVTHGAIYNCINELL